MWRRVGRSLHFPKRNEAFAKVTKEDLSHFRSFLPESAVLTSDLDAYNTDWLRLMKGKSTLVLKPSDTSQVQRILQHCSQRCLAVCPQGGRTGLVLGGVPIHDEIVVNMSNMKRIIELDKQQGIVRCEAGVVLETLNTEVQKEDYVVPLDLGAKGSCQIGGNLATNAGGVRYLRYGSLRGSVLGLEAVLADGTVLDSLHAMRKDNTGYDLKQLFIGSEGTLGIITKAAILLPPKPASIKAAFFGLSTFQDVVTLYHHARSKLGEVLSAFEFMDSETLAVVLKHTPDTALPLPLKSRFYALVEVAGSDGKHDGEKLDLFSETAVQGISDLQGVVAANDRELGRFWKLRDSANPACVKEGFVRSIQNYFKYDISLPLDHFYSLVESCRSRVGCLGLTVGYGHIGDCNLHLNVVIADLAVAEQVRDILEPYVFEYVQKVEGSVSAEHGIGLYKRDKLHFSRNATHIKYMVSSM